MVSLSNHQWAPLRRLQGERMHCPSVQMSWSASIACVPFSPSLGGYFMPVGATRRGQPPGQSRFRFGYTSKQEVMSP